MWFIVVYCAVCCWFIVFNLPLYQTIQGYKRFESHSLIYSRVRYKNAQVL